MAVLRSRLGQRFREILVSVYLYNEHRGYTHLEQALEVLSRALPGETALLESVRKHLEDERRHYLMFRDYLQKRGKAPFRVGPRFGYVDQLVRRVRGLELNPEYIARIGSDMGEMIRLFRLIMVTEKRGVAQVAAVLRMRWVLEDPDLTRIFRVIERDEPSHWMPYAEWLGRRGLALATWRERLADLEVHYSVALFKFWALFLDRSLPRTGFPA